MSMRLVPSATLERICVSPRVNSAEPWHAGSDVHLALDRPDLVLGAAVGPLLVDGDPAAGSCPSPGRRRRARPRPARSGSASVVAGAGVLLEDLLLDRLERRPAARASRGSASPRRASRRGRPRSARASSGSTLGASTSTFSLPAFWRELLDRRADLLDLLVRDVEGVENLGLADALGPALDHQDRLAGAGDDEVHLELLVGLLGRVDDEVAVELSDAHGADVRWRPGSGRSRARRRRRSSPGCRTGARTRPTAAGQTIWVSKCQPFGNSGRTGRSIIRAVSVAFSPARPSRRKKEPGILPAA